MNDSSSTQIGGFSHLMARQNPLILRKRFSISSIYKTCLAFTAVEEGYKRMSQLSSRQGKAGILDPQWQSVSCKEFEDEMRPVLWPVRGVRNICQGQKMKRYLRSSSPRQTERQNPVDGTPGINPKPARGGW